MNITRRNDRSLAPRNSWDLFREFDDLFNQLNGRPFTASSRDEEQMMSPATDIHENDKGYLMSFDLPGVPQDNVKIEVNDGVLTVSGERRRESTKDEKGWTRTERSFGRFVRSFSIPQDIDPAKIEAQFENGELHLFLPKGEMSKPRTIAINASKDASGSGGERKGLMDRFFGKEKTVGSTAQDQAKH